jgi:hypothetical protein
MERYMRVTKVEERDWVDFSMFFLGGAALSLMQGQAAGAPTQEVGWWSWRWYQDKLRRQYQPFNKLQVIRDQLVKLKQGNDSLVGYQQAFIRLAGMISDMPDSEKLGYFRRGLKPELALEIDKADGVMTYERATGLAAKIESAVNTLHHSKAPIYSNNWDKAAVGKYKLPNSNYSGSSSSSSYGSGSSSSNFKGPSTQSITKLNELSIEDNHDRAEGEGGGEIVTLNAMNNFKKLSPEERTKLMKEGKCFYCREVGHRSKECPKKNKNNSKSTDQGKGEARHQ